MTKINPFNLLDFLLQVKGEDRTCVQIILWWELRRILYNFIVGIVGICCWIALVSLIPQKGSQDIPEPIAVAAFAYLCNICYCLGWLTESVLRISTKNTDNLHSPFYSGKTYGPFCFKLGLYFTLFVMLLPVGLWSVFNLLAYFEVMHFDKQF